MTRSISLAQQNRLSGSLIIVAGFSVQTLGCSLTISPEEYVSTELTGGGGSGASSHTLVITGGRRDHDDKFPFGRAITAVWTAPLYADGTVGSFTGAAALAYPLEHHSAAVRQGVLHVAGEGIELGSGPAKTLGVVFQTDISQGPPQTWSTTAVPAVDHETGGCRQECAFRTAAIGDTHFYFIGGGECGEMGAQYKAAYDDVWVGLLDDPTSTQEQTSTLPEGRFGHSSVTYGSWVYAIGGATADGSQELPLTSILVAQANGASLGAWTEAGNMPPATEPLEFRNHASIVINDQLYIVGGAESAAIYRASLDTGTGALGAWQTAGQLADVTAVEGAALVHQPPYLYVIGGGQRLDPTDHLQPHSTVQFAEVAADGSLPGFTQTTELPLAVGFAGAVSF